MKAKYNWYKGLGAAAVAVTLAGAVYTVPAFAEDDVDVTTSTSEAMTIEQAAGSVVEGVIGEGEVRWETPQPDPEKENTTVTDGTIVEEKDQGELCPTGEVKREETETEEKKDPVYDPSQSTETTETVTNPDGSTTTTTTTTTPGTQETTTTTDGTLTGEKEPEFTEDNLSSEQIREELGDVDWSKVEKGGTVGGYNVEEIDKENGSYTLSKTEEQTGTLSDGDIEKLLGEGYSRQEDGSLVKRLDDDTLVLVTITDNKVTRTTTTTLTVSVKETESERKEGSETVDKTPVTDIKDKEGSEISVEEALALAEKGTNVTRDEKGNITGFEIDGKKYTFTYTEDGEKTDISGMTDDKILELLGEGYSLENGEIVDKDGHVLSIEEKSKLVQKTKITVTVVDSKGGKSEEKTDADVKDITDRVEEDAKLAALIKAAQTEGLGNLSASDFTYNETDGTYFCTVNGKKYTFTLRSSTDSQDGEWIAVSDDGEIADKKTTTITGTAYVTGSTSSWSEDKEEGMKDFTIGISNGLASVSAPEDVDAGSIKYDEKGRVTDYTITKDGKTTHYTFTYSDLTEDELKDLKEKAGENADSIDPGSLVKIDYTVSTKETVSNPISDRISTGAEIVEGEDGKFIYREGTLSAELTKNEDGTYVDKDGKIYSVTERDALPEEIKALLESKGYTNVSVDEDGNATYTDKDGKVITARYDNAKIQVINIESRIEDTKASTDKDTILKWLDDLKEMAEAGDDITIDGIHFSEKTIEEWKTWIEEGSAVNFDALSEEELIELLKNYKKNGKEQTDINHVDLDVDSKLTLSDGTNVDCVIMGDGLTFTYNDDASDLVKNNNGGKISLKDTISRDTSSGYNEYQHTGDSRHPNSSQYYKVTGKVAYGTDTGIDGKYSKGKWEAEEALEKYKQKYVSDGGNADDLKDAVIIEFKTSQNWDAKSYYRIYLHQADLVAYGYMTKDSNTCSMGAPYYNGHSGYDLTLSNLRQLADGRIVASGKNVKTYSANVVIVKKEKKAGKDITADISYEKESETSGSDIAGKYTVSYKESKEYGESDSYKGTAEDDYESYRNWLETEKNGEADGVYYEGTLGYTYEIPGLSEISGSKLTETKDAFTLKYSYTTSVTEPVDPKVEIRTTTTTPVIPPIEIIEEIKEEDPPLVNPPAEEPTVIEDEETPLAPSVPDDVIDTIIEEIEDEVIPLASVPQTGVASVPGSSTVPGVVSGGLLAGLAALILRKKRRG